jgi:hypothetical protein
VKNENSSKPPDKPDRRPFLKPPFNLKPETGLVFVSMQRQSPETEEKTEINPEPTHNAKNENKFVAKTGSLTIRCSDGLENFGIKKITIGALNAMLVVSLTCNTGA